MFNPVKQEKVYQLINRQIQDLLITGKLKKGEKLPGERQLAEMFNVSRTSIRESLRSLEIMGLIESRPGEGNFVSSSDTAIMFEPLSIMFKLNNGTFNDILEIRNILEVEAAAIAAEKITDIELEQLKQLMVELEESEDETRSIAIDLEIHFMIARSTRNYLIVTILDAISTLMSEFIKDARKIIMTNITEQGRLLTMHQNLVQALYERNPARARIVMKEHFDTIIESIDIDKL